MGERAGTGATRRPARATEFAWQVHAAQASWAKNADVKASILLALEGGALYAVIAALGAGGFLARLGREGIGRDGDQQVIFFGDLRRWESAELSSHIAGLAAGQELDMLSRQLTEMSRHNWAKHRWVQISLVLSLAGILTIAAFAMITLLDEPGD